MPGRPFVRLAVRLTVALAIFLATGEVLARAVGIVDRLNGYTRLLYVRGPSDDLPYLLRPGVELTYLGMPTRINRAGLRGPDVAPVPAPGVRRLLVVGDSVVFGQGLREEDTVSVLLATRLDGAGGARWETLNGGVPGFDAVAEARFLETAGVALHPSAVVVGTSLNDYDVAPTLSPLGILTRKPLGQPREDLVDHSEFLVLLRWLVAYLRGGLWYQMVEHVEETRRTAPPPATGPAPLEDGLGHLVQVMHLRFYQNPEPPYWNRLRAAFRDLARVAAEHHLPLLVAIFPEKYQVGTPDPDLTPQQRLLDACREAALRCLDLQPAFASAGGDLFADAQHPNARGHVVAADAIAKALLDPATPGIQATGTQVHG